MITESVPIGSIHPDPANARMHSERNIEAIKGSLARFGQQKPIVVDGGGIVRAGNGTLEAAKALGWEEISVVRSDLMGSDMTAFAIADNRTAELAEWDSDVLAQTLAALSDDAAVDVEDAGFSAGEMAAVMEAAQAAVEVVEDEVPEVPEVPITQTGDLWLLGDHRVLCGDAGRPEDWELLMWGETARMAFADPPYDLYDTTFVGHLEAHTRNAHVFVMCDDRQVQGILGASEMPCERFFVMDIGFCVPHGFDAYIQHILVARLANGSPPQMNITGDGFRSILRMDYRGRLQEGEREGHPHQKPLDSVAVFITHYSQPSERVVDPFLGSGTTLIAAEQTGRRCYGMEISPAYCDVIVQRWENLTGGTATRGTTP